MHDGCKNRLEIMGKFSGSASLWLHAVAPFWGLALSGTTLVSALLGVSWLALFGHIAALTLVFHLWHVALHDPRSGRLYVQHQRHHQIHSGRSFLSAHYHSEDGLLQELTLFFAAVILLGISAALGQSGRMLATCALAYVALIVAGGWLHRVMHVSGHVLGRFRWFRVLRSLHFQHHVDPRSNLGIIECGIDALHGSLQLPGRSA